LKSITETTLEEKHAATLVSSTFHATSKISPFPLKLFTCLPSRTFQMYNCPASDPLARYSPDGENATEYTESRCRDKTRIHVPFCTFHNLTDPSKDAVASMRGFVGFMDPCPVGLLHYDMSPTIDSARGNQKMREISVAVQIEKDVTKIET